MKSKFLAIGSFVAVLAISQCAMAFVGAVSTFDTNMDNWTGSFLSWQSAGGNPGGFAQYNDGNDGHGFITAPAKFLGDWSNLTAADSITFDHTVILVGGTPTNVPFEIDLSGPGGSYKWLNPAAPTVGTWQSFVATMDPNNGMWTNVSGTWAGLLANVTSFKISIEAINNSQGTPLDIDGIDNVRVSPEPATMVLLGAGALTLLRRKKVS